MRVITFTERARSALDLAGDGQHAITPVHLLLALLDTGGTAADVLENLGVPLSQVAASIVIEPTVPAGPFTRTREAQTVLQFALQEAHRRRDAYLGTPHLLVGLLRQEGTVATTLNHFGVGLEETRTEVERLLGTAHPGTRRMLSRTPGPFSMNTVIGILLVLFIVGIAVPTLRRLRPKHRLQGLAAMQQAMNRYGYKWLRHWWY